jgi:DNA-binding PadR family transcriptional regulator
MIEISKTTLYILISLAEKPLHGYAIMTRVAEESHKTVLLGPGTLYGALKRLLENGWVEESFGDEPTMRSRRYYKLTDEGRAQLNLEIERLQSILSLYQHYNGMAL